MAAYEPEKLKLGVKKPLIIWLHGQGEGGTDPDIDILGTETSALAKEEIQKYFIGWMSECPSEAPTTWPPWRSR